MALLYRQTHSLNRSLEIETSERSGVSPLRASLSFDRVTQPVLGVSRSDAGGGDFRPSVALTGMDNQHARPTPDALDALIAQLLDCGGVLSQMIGHMQAFDSSGLSSPETRSVLEVAHSVIRSVLGDVSERHSEEEIRVSAELVEQVTAAMCDEIFIFPPAEIRRMRGESGSASPRRRRRQRASRRRRG